MKENLVKNIYKAANVVGNTYPLYAFVTSNPLSGYENTPFKSALQSAENLLGGNLLPTAANFREAWERGEINEQDLMTVLAENGMHESPEYYLKKLDSSKKIKPDPTNNKLDRLLVKWLMAFMDEGLAEWEMPFKEDGFYNAWRLLAVYDNEIDVTSLADIPQNSENALTAILENYTEAEQLNIMEYHLATLPGWTGYIKHRETTQSLWQQNYSITLVDYLAVRLWLANHIQAPILPPTTQATTQNNATTLSYTWLKAWERSWQNNLLKNLTNQPAKKTDYGDKKVPDAQLAFCIDTRSELIRRNIESKGNYETFGYAGFFGIAMDYESLADGLTKKSCPPIVPSAYKVSEVAKVEKEHQARGFQKRNERKKITDYFLTRMKNMLPSAFGYVEGSGVFYGISLLSRTLIPAFFYNPNRINSQGYENHCNPKIKHNHRESAIDLGISLDEKIAIVKSAFNLLGWEEFSPLVLFVGHGSHSANNPFGSSLDCGACAASPGRHNARMLAQLANLPDVRKALKEQHNVHIPEQTLFLGAEHNTTTDEIVVFDSEVPETHKEQLNLLKNDLRKAQESATNERLGVSKNGISTAQNKANNWSETRPEWGLAKNAGFIIGPRSLTKNMNLKGNCFLHSYNWELDKNGEFLETIMQGPMVVTQWINNHYYFSTVDNEKFGGGSKITHNITGRFGVVQGNGGDLRMGLPLQSVYESDKKMYHHPLRLSVLIQAPTENIQAVLNKNENLKMLLDNEWIYLLAMDPTKDNSISRYHNGMQWVPAETW